MIIYLPISITIPIGCISLSSTLVSRYVDDDYDEECTAFKCGTLNWLSVRLGKHLSTVAHVQQAVSYTPSSHAYRFFGALFFSIFIPSFGTLMNGTESTTDCWRCNIFQTSGSRLCYKHGAAKARSGSPFIACIRVCVFLFVCLCVNSVCVAGSFGPCIHIVRNVKSESPHSALCTHLSVSIVCRFNPEMRECAETRL